jgi:transcriptional regulator
MYVPPAFAVADRAWARRSIDSHPFGLLITCEAEYPVVSHIPMIAEEREGELWILGHIARANAHVQAILDRSPATLVFTGPHAYVSASWYEQPYETVPTWNYEAVHVCGTLRETDAWRIVELLSAAFEQGRTPAWDPQRLDPVYRDKQLRGIVAFELRADRIYAKAKLSQNRTVADRERVIDALSQSENDTDRECAREMQLFLDERVHSGFE